MTNKFLELARLNQKHNILVYPINDEFVKADYNALVELYNSLQEHKKDSPFYIEDESFRKHNSVETIFNKVRYTLIYLVKNQTPYEQFKINLALNVLYGFTDIDSENEA